MASRGLSEKSSDADLLWDMTGFAAERPMARELDGPNGADRGERSEGRINQRKGYRERDWQIRARTVEQRIPQLRRCRCFPAFLDPRQMAEKALTAVVQEAYFQSTPTGSLHGLVRAMGMEGINQSRESRLCTGINERVQDFLPCPNRARLALSLARRRLCEVPGGSAPAASRWQPSAI